MRLGLIDRHSPRAENWSGDARQTNLGRSRNWWNCGSTAQCHVLLFRLYGVLCIDHEKESGYVHA